MRSHRRVEVSICTGQCADPAQPETHEVTGPPGVIRFALGTPARCSGVWRVWSGPRASDVYVGVRHYAEIQKYSLHETGKWHHAFQGRRHRGSILGLEPRFLETWERPTDAPAGWTLALAVRVPHVRSPISRNLPTTMTSSGFLTPRKDGSS